MASHKLVAIVTGANQGIGLEIARALACTYGIRTIVTARSADKCAATQDALRAEGGDVTALQLDVCSDDSVRAFASQLRERTDVVDILVNNAGFAYKGDVFGAEEARHTMNTNFYGTIRVTEAVLPLMRGARDPRIVNVCSQAGRLSQVSPALQAQFQAPDATKESITALVERFLACVKDNTYAEAGWPRSMYGISKLAEIAWTYALARQLSHGDRPVAVQAVCPGYCSTSMSSFRGPRSPAKGAETPVWLATKPRDVGGAPVAAAELTGGFWYDQRLIAW